MKKILITAVALSIGFMSVAQEKIEETKVKKTYVKDQNGTKVITTKKTTTENDNILLTTRKDATNFNTTDGAKEINTTITYTFEEGTFKFNKSPEGYVFMQMDQAGPKIFATLEPHVIKNTYLFNQDGKKNKAYFNDNGDLVVEVMLPDGNGTKTITYKTVVKDKM